MKIQKKEIQGHKSHKRSELRSGIQTLTWDQFERYCKEISDWARPYKFKNIYGIPRGGLLLAGRLSSLLQIPQIYEASQMSKETLIVDDIADSGRTLSQINKLNCKTATLFYRRGSIIRPNKWLAEKTYTWVLFPWEKSDKTGLELAVYSSQLSLDWVIGFFEGEGCMIIDKHSILKSGKIHYQPQCNIYQSELDIMKKLFIFFRILGITCRIKDQPSSQQTRMAYSLRIEGFKNCLKIANLFRGKLRCSRRIERFSVWDKFLQTRSIKDVEVYNQSTKTRTFEG